MQFNFKQFLQSSIKSSGLASVPLAFTSASETNKFSLPFIKSLAKFNKLHY